jgi:hypothetical protein
MVRRREAGTTAMRSAIPTWEPIDRIAAITEPRNGFMIVN